MTRTPLSNRRGAISQRMTFAPAGAEPVVFEATYGLDRNGIIREVFCKPFRVGVDMQLILRQASIGFSVALQHGATMTELAHAMGEDDPQASPRSILGLMVRAGAVLDDDLAEAMKPEAVSA